MLAPVATQPYALVLVVHRPDLTIRAITENAAAFCGRKPADLLGGPLSALLPRAVVAELIGSISESFPGVVPLGAVVGWPVADYQAVGHTFGDELVVEVEPRRSWPHAGDYTARLKDFTYELETAPSVDVLLRRLCNGLIYHFGYDRALVVQLGEHAAGVVTHEAPPDGTPPLVGVRFHAADLPAAARYAQLVEGVYNYTREGNGPLVKLVGECGPGARELLRRHLASRGPLSAPVDLLVDSPVSSLGHLALTIRGALWGTVYLLSTEPLYLDYQMRGFLTVVGRVAQQKMAHHFNSRELGLQRQLGAVRDRLREHLVRADTLAGGLAAGQTTLLDLLGPARGAAIRSGEVLIRCGATPPEADIHSLVDWVRETHGAGSLYHTDQLGNEYPPGAAYAAVAAGVLYLPLDDAAEQWILWCSPAVEQRLTYGSVADDRPARAGSRRFLLHEVVSHGRARAWDGDTVAAARALRTFLRDVVMQRYARTKRQNARLRTAYRDLEAFSYTISHDLRAPLRGMAGYAEIIEEDFAAQLGPEGVGYLRAIRQQAARMGTFLSDLLSLSRLDGSGMDVAELSVERLVARVLHDRRTELGEHFVCRVQPDLPPIQGDHRYLTILITNLLSNAIKYSARAAAPRVTVGLHGYARGGHPVFYVADNGIGIPRGERSRVFELFARSTNAGEFSGTGIGLALVQRIVNFHDGEIWIEDEPTGGTRFLFYTGVQVADSVADSP